MSAESRTKSFDMFLGDWADDEDSKEKMLFKAVRPGRVTAAKLFAATTVTDADTDYNTFSLKKGTTEIASLANGPAATGVPISDVATGGGTMTLSSTLTALEFAAGDVINLVSVKTGNGLAVADLSIHIAYDDIG